MTIYPEINQERFWSKVRKTDQCWLWTAATFRRGYGQYHVNGCPMRAHRISWMIAHKQNVPDGLNVLHTCDVPGCVNPDHLFLGTSLDNNRDTVAKGRAVTGNDHWTRKYPQRVPRGDKHVYRLHPERHARGDKCPRTKLNPDSVRAIRDTYALGIVSSGKLAKQYGVSKPNILAIIHHKTWSYV